MYRNQVSSLLQLHSELYRDRQRELDDADAALGSIYARRVARTLAGALAFVGMSVVFVAGMGAIVYWTFDLPPGVARMLGLALVFTWLATVAVYGFARWAAAIKFRLVLSRELAPTGDLHAEISRLSRADGRAVARDVITRWERRSIVWPLMGASLAMPLLLHYAVACALGRQLWALNEFGMWIGLSAFTVGHCHYFAAHQALGFARALREERLATWDEVRGYAWRAVLVAIGTSLMPGLAALGVPCVVVALTALAFLPASYYAMHRAVESERVKLTD